MFLTFMAEFLFTNFIFIHFKIYLAVFFVCLNYSALKWAFDVNEYVGGFKKWVIIYRFRLFNLEGQLVVHRNSM